MFVSVVASRTFAGVRLIVIPEYDRTQLQGQHLLRTMALGSEHNLAYREPNMCTLKTQFSDAAATSASNKQATFVCQTKGADSQNLTRMTWQRKTDPCSSLASF